jgi:hypothetical protein
MALLNPPQILPNLAELIYRHLLHAERQMERRETLIALLAPASLGQNGGNPGSRALDDTLRACEQIRLIKSEADAVRLHPGLPHDITNRRSGERAFRRVLRQLVMAPDLNEGEWGSQEGARDLTYSLAWYLRQDLYSPPATWDLQPPLLSVQVAQHRQLGGAVLLVNDTRWGAFMRWATYLGFAVHHAFDGNMYLVPDATVAIRDALSACCGGPTGEMDLPSVLGLVAQSLPVLDGGEYRREVERHLRPGQYRDFPPETLSTALSHGLRRLDDLGVITVSDRADAPKVTFTSELGQRVVRSHISWTSRILPHGEVA